MPKIHYNWMDSFEYEEERAQQAYDSSIDRIEREALLSTTEEESNTNDYDEGDCYLL